MVGILRWLNRTAIDLLDRVPGKKLMFRLLYQWLAGRQRDDFVFMNYGYAEDGFAPELPADVETERYPAHLYLRAARADLVRGRELLEVGCGRAGGLSLVQRVHGPRRTAGVDLSSRVIAGARDRRPELDLHVGDAERLPFGPASFDVVLNVESSHCYRTLPAFYGEVVRVLRPGGHFLYTDFFNEPRQDRVDGMLAGAGLETLERDDITAHVLAALSLDDPRKRALVAGLPGWLRRPFLEFAAVEGSWMQAQLRAGTMQYRCYVLRKAGPEAE